MKWELDMQDIAEENYERGFLDGQTQRIKEDIAKNLLDVLDNATIAKATELPLEQIELFRSEFESV